jgi:anaerobic magnesium-protoporphyrin IX monomethyl ester cyclase
MRILLVRAKPDFMDMLIGIPSGLALVGAMAEKMNHEVEILDLALERKQEVADQMLEQKLREKHYDLAGLTAMTVEFESAARAARMIKAAYPQMPIVFGGQHSTIKAEDVAGRDFCDYVVRGEGEKTFAEFLVALEAGTDLGQVPGLAFKRDGKIVSTAKRELIQDLDALPYPAYHLLDIERYFTSLSARTTPRNKRCMQIFTSRGCPWHCIYCHDLFGKGFRARSPESVMKEIRMLYDRYRISDFMMEDDIFNFDMKRAKKIFDLIISSNLKLNFQFNNGVRVELFDEELIHKMAQGGTYFVSVAVETASPRVQKVIRKNLKLDRAKEVVSWLRKYKIRSLGFFMMGLPTETEEEINQTIKFACNLDLDEALFSIATPYPGTELSRYITEKKMYDPDRVSQQGGETFQQLRTEELDFAKLKKLQRKAYFMFFMTRYRFLRMLPRLLNVNSSKKYLKAIERNFLAYGGAKTTRVN